MRATLPDMLGYRTSLAVAGALVAGLLVATPVEATPGYRTYWVYDQPGTLIASAEATYGQTDVYEVGVHATVHLLADPPAGSDVHLAFGVLDDADNCVADEGDSVVVAPVDGSRTVELDGVVELPDVDICSYISVTDFSGSVVDRVGGRVDREEPIYMGEDEQILGVRHRRVPVNRWSWVEVRLGSGETVERVRVLGDGRPGARFREARQALNGSRTTVRLPVKLTSRRAQDVVITALFRGEGAPTVKSDVVRITPKR
ncbi:hypothetical protein [Nocardioides sp. SR21]|uniref:hypothetical protein n=1 Tax=Nocardioides sp. SR21 TaxID=2919501 RepID=UPI001FA96BFA|nr:hypothetical protein [Nocardioides sp. SR21]